MNAKRIRLDPASRRELLSLALGSLAYLGLPSRASARPQSQEPPLRIGAGAVRSGKRDPWTGWLTVGPEAVDDGERQRSLELRKVSELPVPTRAAAGTESAESDEQDSERELLRHAERLLADARDVESLEAWLALLHRGYLPSAPIGPPLEGPVWAVPDPTRHHAAHAASVFALDLAALDDRGPVHRERGERNEDYASWNTRLLAVADGTVVRARDLHPENEVNQGVADPARANDLVLRYDGGLAFYRHLRQGSLQVGPGQNVKRGDVLARIGNSGNGSWPHLHFAVYEHFEIGAKSGTLSVPIAVDADRVTGFRKRVAGKAKKLDVRCSNAPLQEGWVVAFEA